MVMEKRIVVRGGRVRRGGVSERLDITHFQPICELTLGGGGVHGQPEHMNKHVKLNYDKIMASIHAETPANG